MFCYIWTLWYVQKIIMIPLCFPEFSFYVLNCTSESMICSEHVTINHFIFQDFYLKPLCFFKPTYLDLRLLEWKSLCIYSYYVPTCGAFSFVTWTAVLKCSWPMFKCNTGVWISEIDKWCFFFTKEHQFDFLDSFSLILHIT